MKHSATILLTFISILGSIASLVGLHYTAVPTSGWNFTFAVTIVLTCWILFSSTTIKLNVDSKVGEISRNFKRKNGTLVQSQHGLVTFPNGRFIFPFPQPFETVPDFKITALDGKTYIQVHSHDEFSATVSTNNGSATNIKARWIAFGEPIDEVTKA